MIDLINDQGRCVQLIKGAKCDSNEVCVIDLDEV